MIEQIIIVLHVLVALAIIALILLQQGKGADMGASFGAGSSQTLFGPSGGGNVLTRATAILAAVFFSTSFGLAIIAKQKASVSVEEAMISVPAAITEQVEGEAAELEPGLNLDELPDFESESAAGQSLTPEDIIEEAASSVEQDIVDSIPE